MTLRSGAIAVLVLVTMPLSAMVIAYRSYRTARQAMRAAAPTPLPRARVVR